MIGNWRYDFDADLDLFNILPNPDKSDDKDPDNMLNCQHSNSVADPPLNFRPNWEPKGRKNFLETGRPPPLSKGLDDRPPVSQGLDPALQLFFPNLAESTLWEYHVKVALYVSL